MEQQAWRLPLQLPTERHLNSPLPLSQLLPQKVPLLRALLLDQVSHGTLGLAALWWPLFLSLFSFARFEPLPCCQRAAQLRCCYLAAPAPLAVEEMLGMLGWVVSASLPQWGLLLWLRPFRICGQRRCQVTLQGFLHSLSQFFKSIRGSCRKRSVVIVPC